MLNKSYLFWLIIISFTIIVNAQNEQSDYQYNYNPNVLVHSRGLPGEMLLFSPDSSVQILFNPARALNYSTNFIYPSYISDFNKGINFITNYYYYYDRYPYPVFDFEIVSINFPNFPNIYEETYSNEKNPTLSINTLLGSNENKWLISFANGVNTLEKKTIAKYVNTITLPYDTSYFNNSTEDENYKENNDNYITKFNIFNIRKTNFGNIFYGISATINNLNIEAKNYTEGFRKSSSNSIEVNETIIENSKIENDNNLYQGGLNFGFNTSRLDYVGKIYYVYSENKMKNEQNYFNHYINKTFELNISDTRQISKNNFNSKRKGLLFQNYFQSELNNSFFKNIFVTLDAFYLNNKLNLDATSEYEYKSNYSADTSFSTNIPKSLDENDWGFRISTGLTFNKKIDNLYILSGFILDGSHSDVHNFIVGNINIIDQFNNYFFNEKNNVFTLTLPIYLNLDLFKFLSLYGGFNFAYQYVDRNTKGDNEIDYYNSSPPQERIYEYYYKTDDDNFKSYKSVYAGVEFKHKSGLVMQISFDEDISTFQDWNFSLGYHF